MDPHMDPEMDPARHTLGFPGQINALSKVKFNGEVSKFLTLLGGDPGYFGGFGVHSTKQ